MSETESGLDVLLADVGAVRLALPMAAVRGVDLEPGPPVVDAGSFLGLASADGSRRVRVQGRQAFDLGLDGQLRVLRLGEDALAPLPRFLSGLQGRLGLMGLARVEGDFALFLDPSALEPA